jgi:chorismate mutase/prephenate dehydratase
VDYGLAPIENSIGGGIAETLAAFQEFHEHIRVYAEVQLEVHHALLANCAPSRVRRIYSKPEVFQQCRTWLATQYPQAELVAEASSSAAVKRVVEEANGRSPGANRRSGKRRGGTGGGVAAIGSALAAEIYDVNVLFENIEDKSNNITRFFVIRGTDLRAAAVTDARESMGRPGAQWHGRPSGKLDDGRPGDKTSIMFTTGDKPGALVSVLRCFDRAGINLTHIDKRPSGRSNWTYTFFIDAEGHTEDPGSPLNAAVKDAAAHCKELHVLGSYPRSRRIL